MYTYIWNKYFPVIRILMKRSASAEQTLELSRTDFERLGKGSKASYKFNIEFNNGKPTAIDRDNEFVKAFVSLLQEDETTKLLVSQNDYEFSFNTKFQLSVKNIKKHELALPEEIDADESSLSV